MEAEAIVQAVRNWTNDKSRSIGQILLEQAQIDLSELEALQKLAGRRAKKYGGVERGLASVKASESLLKQLETIDDDDLQASVAYLTGAGSATHPSGTNEDDRGGFKTTPDKRFKKLGFHKGGGLGEIYEAIDVELDRKVAFKEISLRLAHDTQLRARFLQEANVTGLLEHPNVVPIYGHGRFRDGRPYYVMKFIKGESLKELIERMNRVDRQKAKENEASSKPTEPDSKAPIPNLRELMYRFIDVCEAIEYAHSRGVLHRDLKPSNIMLGKFGETLVVDWGVAKILNLNEATAESTEGFIHPSSGSGILTTEANTSPGTLEYMSPEQAAGRIDELGPASDVYSLGATLYCFLTGRAPYKVKEQTASGREAVRQQVIRGEFTPPSELKPSIPKPLAAICMKSMQNDPKDRYTSAKAMAEDIENWLVDERVQAYLEPVLSRLARWARNHRPMVAGAAVLMVSGLLFSLGYSYSLSVKNAKIEAEERQLAEANIRARFLCIQSAGAISDLYDRLAQPGLAQDSRIGRIADGSAQERGNLHTKPAIGLSSRRRCDQSRGRPTASACLR